MNNITEDCKKYLGITPYNQVSNVCLLDIYYLESLYSKYGREKVQEEIGRLISEEPILI